METSSAQREPDAIYQGSRIVARVLDLEIDLAAKQVWVGEVYESDALLRRQECELREYRIVIDITGRGVRAEGTEPSTGNVLKRVASDPLGCRQQGQVGAF